MQEKPLIYCAGKQANAAVIWLHGLGADGHDFYPVCEILNLPHIRFVLPHAPHRPITLNNGYEMRGWYDLFGLDPSAKQDIEGIRQAQENLTQLITEQAAFGILPGRIVLAGFSQGGAVALQTATRFEQTLAGVLALSTYLPLKPMLAAEKNAVNLATPIFMAHGLFDEIISLETACISRDCLLAENFNLDWHEYPMAHSVIPAEIDDIRDFLTKVLPI